MVVLPSAAPQIIDFGHAIVLEVLRDRRRWSAVTVPDHIDREGSAMAGEHQAYIGPIVTRNDAMAAGLKRYFTGLPCGHGHFAERYVSGGCAECTSIKRTKWNYANPEKRLLCDRKSREKNHDVTRETQRAYERSPHRMENRRARERVSTKAPLFKSKRRAYSKLPHVREAISIYNITPQAKEIRRVSNARPEAKIRRAAYMRLVRSTPMGCINDRMARGLNRGLSNGKNGEKWESLVGYTKQQLTLHIERQFVKGMNWDNRRQWHIDHIVPLASFIFTSVDDGEFKAAWAITNLRPLWKLKNLQKSSTREFLL